MHRLQGQKTWIPGLALRGLGQVTSLSLFPSLKKSLHLRTTVRIRQEPPSGGAHSLSSRPRPHQQAAQPTCPEAIAGQSFQTLQQAPLTPWAGSRLPIPPAWAWQTLSGGAGPAPAPQGSGQQVDARSSGRTRRKGAGARAATVCGSGFQAEPPTPSPASARVWPLAPCPRPHCSLSA